MMKTLTHFDFKSRINRKPAVLLYNELCDGRSSFNERNDCAVVAVSQACEVPYADVHRLFKQNGRRDRCATKGSTTQKVVKSLGYKLVPIETASRSVRSLELELAVMPGNCNYIVRTRRHLLAVVNGSVQDWTAGRKHRPKHVFRVEKSHDW